MSNNSKIEYRKATDEDKLHIMSLQSIFFAMNSNEEDVRESIKNGDSYMDTLYSAVGEDGGLLAGIAAIPYTMWFDGNKVPMCGIGGVVSAPESRRRGNIRNLTEKIFDDVYEKGAVFSHLFPFSHDYYRKFGFEHVGAARKYTLPLANTKGFQSSGTVYKYINGDEIRSELIDVYESYASRHNIMISRSDNRWNDVFKISLFDTNYLYYWKDSNGKTKSWAKFSISDDTMNIRDIAWVDHESMLGIFQFFGMFDSSAKMLCFKASPEFTAELYWNNLYHIEVSYDWLGMNRVVNAKRALELLHIPDYINEGSFTIKINDKFAKWNTGTYEVKYGSGENTVKMLSPTASADIETSELALVQMILGVYDFEQVSRRSDVIVSGDLNSLKRIFPKKSLLITDGF
ncbi:MAG: GNAT family N-acetyltransferase [Oscillospiraceae bacterium]|jgi:predicted acetyltransferase|nr:GNAT family N-acetyltransferase [Oscillospiraceae bacterium]